MIKRVIVTGSLSYDYIMSMPTYFKDHIMPDKIHELNVSFIMKKYRREFGGTAGNIAFTMSLLKTPILLVGTVGKDFPAYKKHLQKYHINTSALKIYKHTPTASGFVMTDASDNQIWGFFEGAMKYASKIKLEDYFSPGDFLIISPNDPLAMVKYAKLAIKFKIPYLFDPAFNIPHISKQNLLEIINSSYILIGNDYEIELISRKLGLSKNTISKYVEILITTLGAKGSIVAAGNQKLFIKPAKPFTITDPTGAGDAYRAGFVSGLVKNKPLKTCGMMGSIAAVYTVEKYGTQTHSFSINEFQKRYKANFHSSLSI